MNTVKIISSVRKYSQIVVITCAMLICTLLSPAAADSSDPSYPERITLVFGGDVMLDRGVAKKVASSGAGDYRFPWLNIADYFNQADIAFVNLESMITDKGVLNYMKPAPWFRASPDAMIGLQYAGIDVVSVANNHAFDYNRSGFRDCLARLHAAGIQYVGGGLNYDEAYSPIYITAKGKKIAYLGYMNILYYSWRALSGSAGITWLSEKGLKYGISKAKANNADLIVVSMHFGNEYRTKPNSSQQKYAKMAIDLGADIVVGHHPHVTQPTVIYTDKVICYSLGNLIFDQKESSHTGVTRGKVLEVVWENGGVSEVNERYVRINEATWQPAFE
jgi:poly-gamma-glutamate capsule biosynthesis protein CapA/YwtB (metallophosphatase superfamily)